MAPPGRPLIKSALLDDLAAYPVTALVAPAGSGKTTLAADWVGRGGATLRVADMLGARRVARHHPVGGVPTPTDSARTVPSLGAGPNYVGGNPG